MTTAFDKDYFRTHTYAKVSFARFSQYWWSNRFYSILGRRYGRKGSRLLEVGVGLGHLVGQLEGDFKTFGIDINEWALRQDARREAPHTQLQHASAQAMPYASGSFGVVIIKHIVEHLPQPERAIAELGRLLEPGGVLILATPNLDSMLKPLKGERWIGYQDPTHISLRPPAEWLRLIRDEGRMRVEHVWSDGFWDVPYIPVIPVPIQKFFFGALGGFQAITGWTFLPLRWGESLIVVARKGAAVT